MLKNAYSTSAMSNIFADIEKTLIQHKAKAINRDFENGLVTSLSFLIDTNKGTMAVKLPARFDRVEQIFREQGLKFKEGQPYRTAWATIRDWVSTQMALIDWEMVKLEEVFLPYAVDPKTGKTYFEVLENRGFQLGSGVEEGVVEN